MFKKIIFILGIILLSNFIFAENNREWENILNESIGFGKNAIGGKSGSICIVNNLKDEGKGSLRDCLKKEKTWVFFNVSGNINLKSPLEIKSYTTIDGRGQEITIKNYGLVISKISNVVILNIKIRDGYDDAIKIINNAENIWIDSVELSNFKDGLIDITLGARDISISKSKFEDHDKGMLIGADELDIGDKYIRVTLYENFFDSIGGRTPRLRYGKVHMFNNYIYNWDFEAVTSQSLGEIYSENNIFEAGRSKFAIVADDHLPWDKKIGYAVDINSYFLNGANVKGEGMNLEEKVFKPNEYYEYNLKEANDKLKEDIIINSGWKNTSLLNETKIIILKSNSMSELNIDKSSEKMIIAILFAVIISLIYFFKRI